MSRFEVIATEIQGLKVIQSKPIGDARGFLSRVFCAESFEEFGFDKNINQINHTLTREKGTVRGMHYQTPPHAEIKLVSCLHGEVFDVAVDLRKDSPTFLRWHAAILSADNHRSMLIPEGFAHGFQTLTENCELLYLHSASYVKEAEAALNATDPTLSIDWPLPVSERSERDRSHPNIDKSFKGIEI